MLRLKKAGIMALFIIDSRLPEKAKDRLCRFGDIIEFKTNDITYEAISGHPDIFFCKTEKILVTAPNLPEEYVNLLNIKMITNITGTNPVKKNYPDSAIYNAAINDEFLIHRTDITDREILDSCSLPRISVTQGYARCSLLMLKNNSFITSDPGIFRTLSNKFINILYVKSDEIILPGFPHGFFGGVCGILENTVFIAGKLDLFHNGRLVAEFLRSLKYDIIELYDGPLFDCGSILAIS
jgi:hypothetical protein